MKKSCCTILLLALLLALPTGGCKRQEAEPELEAVATLRFFNGSSETTAQTQSSAQSSSAAPPVVESVSRAKPHLINHKLSAAKEKELLMKTGTALDREKKKLKDTEAVFTFAGDCTIGSYPECAPNQRFDTLFHADGSPAYPFDLVRDWFEADDRSIINFEGTLTTATKMAHKSWRFKGEPAFAKILKAASKLQHLQIITAETIWKQAIQTR